MARKRRVNKKSLPIIIIVIILAVVFAALEKSGVTDTLNELASPNTTTSQNNNNDTASDGEKIMTAHFIDVGQGDCTLFIAGDETMLIDCGESEYADTVISDLASYGVTKLTYVVASHAHTDHMGGMADILDAIPAENIILSEPCEKSMGTKSYGEFLDAADRSGADIIASEPGYTFSLGEAECKILAPFSVSDEENDNSVIMHITAGTTSFLMTGDAEKAVEKELIAEYPDLRTTILKVGHHGSKTSSHNDFISMLDCETAVISVGADNNYGHPTEQVLKTLDDNEIDYYRTDLYGTVTIECFANNYTVLTERK